MGQRRSLLRECNACATIKEQTFFTRRGRLDAGQFRQNSIRATAAAGIKPNPHHECRALGETREVPGIHFGYKIGYSHLGSKSWAGLAQAAPDKRVGEFLLSQ